MRIGVVGVGRIGAFHAATVKRLPAVGEVLVTDADPARAEAVAKDLDVGYATDIGDLLRQRPAGLVIAAATSAHAELIGLALAAGVPTFCEKPLAVDLAGTAAVVGEVEAGRTPVQIGFQRRFDAGYRAAAQAVRDGELGWIHTIRANTNDAFPPPAGYLPTSGGLFRDCSVHDFDIIRFVTGREVETVYAAGANRGEPFFAEAGDIDTGAALLTLDDGTFAAVSATRYNQAGHDVRMELLGERGADRRRPRPADRPALRRARRDLPGRHPAPHLPGPLPRRLRRRAHHLHRRSSRPHRVPLHSPRRPASLPHRRRLRTLPRASPAQ